MYNFPTVDLNGVDAVSRLRLTGLFQPDVDEFVLPDPLPDFWATLPFDGNIWGVGLNTDQTIYTYRNAAIMITGMGYTRFCVTTLGTASKPIYAQLRLHNGVAGVWVCGKGELHQITDQFTRVESFERPDEYFIYLRPEQTYLDLLNAPYKARNHESE